MEAEDLEDAVPDEVLAVAEVFVVPAVLLSVLLLVVVAFAVWLDFADAGSSTFFLLPVSFMATSPFWFIAVTFEEAAVEPVLYETDEEEDDDEDEVLLTVSFAYTLAVSAMTVTLSVLMSAPVAAAELDEPETGAGDPVLVAIKLPWGAD